MEEKKRISDPAATVTVTGRGPIHIEGCFVLCDASGMKIRIDGDRVKFCGCGRSKTKPICDGTHKQ